MSRPAVYFSLRGIAPEHDPLWSRVGPEGHRALFDEVGKIGIAVKQASLAKGLDRWGRRMQAIHQLTRLAREKDINPVTVTRPYSPMGRAQPQFPPLQATAALSRTQTLLRFEPRIREGVIDFYWDDDPHSGRNWGDILSLHRRGFTQHFRWPRSSVGIVPPRDVIGLSGADHREIEHRKQRWWLANRAKLVARHEPKIVPMRPAARINLEEYMTANGPIRVTYEEAVRLGIQHQPHQRVGPQRLGPPGGFRGGPPPAGPAVLPIRPAPGPPPLQAPPPEPIAVRPAAQIPAMPPAPPQRPAAQAPHPIPLGVPMLHKRAGVVAPIGPRVVQRLPQLAHPGRPARPHVAQQAYVDLQRRGTHGHSRRCAISSPAPIGSRWRS